MPPGASVRVRVLEVAGGILSEAHGLDLATYRSSSAPGTPPRRHTERRPDPRRAQEPADDLASYPAHRGDHPADDLPDRQPCSGVGRPRGQYLGGIEELLPCSRIGHQPQRQPGEESPLGLHHAMLSFGTERHPNPSATY